MSKKAGPSSQAHLLVLGSNAVYALRPSTLLAQADALLGAHRLSDAAALAERHLRRLQTRIAVSPSEADELRYVYQRLGFQCLVETRFEEAGAHFAAGQLDARVLVRFFPALAGALLGEDESVDLFAGVVEHMPHETSIDELIRNYSPHLPPDTRTAPPARALAATLAESATAMLRVFLQQSRARNAAGSRVAQVVDTALGLIYAEAGDRAELAALLESPNEVLPKVLAPALVKARMYAPLCGLYQARGLESELLDAWMRLVEGEWEDAGVHDPVGSVVGFLEGRRERGFVRTWGVRLLKYDRERAMKLLLTAGLGKRTAKSGNVEEKELLGRIQSVDPVAGTQFLENLVLNRRNADPDWHDQLAQIYISQLLSCLSDEPTEKLWRAKAAAYASTPTDTPYFSYFASTTPDSDARQTRLRAVLFLQGSSLYTPDRALARLADKPLLALERAIVLGKLGRHEDALTTLVRELHDTASAEAYCTLGGAVVPPRAAHALGTRFGLQAWAALLAPVAPAPALERERTVDEGLKRELTRVLLGVYMRGGEAMAPRTARLLNTQAASLDVSDVLATLPPAWPLTTLSSFLARSLRASLHARHEAALVKAIAAAENRAVAERTWGALRAAGAVVEEAASDDEDDGLEVGDEKGVGLALQLDEKAGLRAYEVGGVEVA